MFFASIGLIISPGFVMNHVGLIIGGLVAVMAAKAAVVILAGRGLGLPWAEASMAGLALAQVSEYSLIFTGKAHAMGLLSRRTYLVGLTVTVASLVTSPLAVALHAVLKGVKVMTGNTLVLGVARASADGAHSRRSGVARDGETSAVGSIGTRGAAGKPRVMQNGDQEGEHIQTMDHDCSPTVDDGRAAGNHRDDSGSTTEPDALLPIAADDNPVENIPAQSLESAHKRRYVTHSAYGE